MAEDASAETIAASLTADERRMVLAGALDRGGTDLSSWESGFGNRRDIWWRTTVYPDAHLSPLGLMVQTVLAAQSGDQ